MQTGAAMFKKLIGALAGLAMMGMAGTANAIPIATFYTSESGFDAASTTSTTNFETASGSGSLTIDGNTYSGITAAGGIFGDMTGPAGGSGLLEIFGTTNNLLDSQLVAVGDMGQGLDKTFFGWTVTGDLIATMQFRLTTGDTLFAAVDNFKFGTTEAPEPSTFSLFATGLALLAFLGWRRRGAVQSKAA